MGPVSTEPESPQFSEGDLLPGLIVDRYGEYLVLQSLIQSTDRLQPLLKDLLVERYHPKSILVRNDSRVRELEGLELRQEIIGEPIPDPITIVEDGKPISVSLTTGQKTGSYLDQRENHHRRTPRVRSRARCVLLRRRLRSSYESSV
jgi:23S rRNA (cytosine1962-C5)-methyltransferase